MQHWLARQAGLGYLAPDPSKEFEPWGLGSNWLYGLGISFCSCPLWMMASGREAHGYQKCLAQLNKLLYYYYN